MAMYAVDSRRQAMRSSGIVEQLFEWVDSPDGRRRPSDRQARSEETGMPLWAVEVVYRQASFGREATVTAKVTVGAIHQPVLGDMDPVVLEGLRVEACTNKAGGFTEAWSADGLADDVTSAASPDSTGADRALPVRQRPEPADRRGVLGMSVVAVALVLGALVVLLLRTSRLGLGSAMVCVLFGLVIASTPAGPTVSQGLDSTGSWVWSQVHSL